MPTNAARVQTDPMGTGRFLSLRMPSSNEGVRECIAVSAAFVREVGGSEQDLTAVELAMAEVLNNVVEHAYGDQGVGPMTLEIEALEDEIRLRIRDSGYPMPKGRLPSGQAADTTLADFEQDEGGYGLHMIRQLAKKLRYTRVGEENHLTFRMTLGAQHHWDADTDL